MKIATPISSLFNKNQKLNYVSKYSDCFELREHSPKFQSNKKYYPAFFDPNTNATVGQKIVLMGYALPSDQVSATNLRKSAHKNCENM